HQPDQQHYRQIHTGDPGRADRPEQAGQEMPERDPGENAEGDPDHEVAFEDRHAAPARLTRYPAGIARCGRWIRRTPTLVGTGPPTFRPPLRLLPAAGSAGGRARSPPDDT